MGVPAAPPAPAPADMRQGWKAIAPGAHLLFVGDVDQLPSVGAGEVLRDLLSSGALPRVRLTHIFGQVQDAGVVTNATASTPTGCR